jgi:hypothetical protein
MKLVVMFLLVCLSQFGCGSNERCVVGATRCDNEKVQLCNANGEWTVTDDCRVVAGLNGGNWVCSEADVDAGLPAACLPIDNVDISALSVVDAE